jgi:hypothetical protein
MSEHRITTRWLRYVLRGEGKSRSDANERFMYRGPVLYSHEWPAARLVKGPGKNDWYCVAKVGVRPHNPKEWTTGPQLVATLHGMDCVGVFSKYEGDMNTDGQLHERTRFLAHCAAQLYIEQAQTWPADKLLLKGAWSSTGSDALKVNLDGVFKRYDMYRTAFQLDWPDFPNRYLEEFREAIDARATDYYDPKAVAQRERQLARRDAKHALGLDG